MFKTALLTITGLVVCLSPAAAVEAFTDRAPSERHILPHRPQVHKTVVVVLNGKIEVVDIRFEPCDPLPLGTRVTIKINGRMFVINFDKKSDLLALARKLNGEMVEVEGTLKGDVVDVTSLKKSSATKESVKETTRITIEGPLNGNLVPPTPGPDPRFPMPYVDLGIVGTQWQITVDGTTYTLDLNEELLAKAAKLDGKNVIVTGELEMQIRGPDCIGINYELKHTVVPVVRVETLEENTRRF
jgi:hypothetical protein